MDESTEAMRHLPLNKGHGHVFPRADGVRARCGGPGLCPVCSQEKLQQEIASARPKHLGEPPEAALMRAAAQIEALQREIAEHQRVLSEMASMKNCFRPGHPEQDAYSKVCSIWMTESTPEREQHAYRDGHFAGWQSAVSWMQNKEMLRVARRVITEHSDTLKNLKER